MTTARKLWYLAAPLFSVYERARNVQVARVIEEEGFGVLLPQSIAAPLLQDGTIDTQHIFRECLAQLESADGLLALADGSDVDSGTAWEIGYAFARGLPIILVRTDMRRAEKDVVNAVVFHSAANVVSCSGYRKSPQDVEFELRRLLQQLREANQP